MDAETPAAPVEVVDGRARRWAEHNQARRQALLAEALNAIRSRGAGVGMDEIASLAGTSKPVLYRHFTDRAGLYRAVAAEVDARIVRRVRRALATPGDVPGQLAAVAEAYLSLTEADPEVYRFVVRPPALDSGVSEAQVRGITDRLAQLIGAHLARAVGHARARIWSVGLVGMMQATADRWLAGQLVDESGEPLPRSELVTQLVELVAPGLEPHLIT